MTRSRRTGASRPSSYTDLGEFLKGEIYPALFNRLDSAFPEYGFRRHGNHWQAAQDATRHLPDAPRPARVCCYDNSPWGLVIHGGSFVRFLDLVNSGTKPTGKDFLEAVRKLADLAGVAFPEREFSPEEVARSVKREARRSALETVIHFCHEALFSEQGGAALAYLKGRGYPEEAIREFRLGFYPSCSAVENAFGKAGHNRDALKEAALLWRELEGRVVYPWADATGQPLTLYETGRNDRSLPARARSLSRCREGDEGFTALF